MANFVQLVGTHELQDMWTKEVENRFRARMVLRELLGTKFQSQAKVGGSIVYSQFDFGAGLQDYNVVEGVEKTQTNSKSISIPLTKDKGFSKILDIHEVNAVAFDLIEQTMKEGSYQVANALENNAIISFTQDTIAGVANPQKGTLSKLGKPSETNAYQQLLDEITLMREQNLMDEDLIVLVSNQMHRHLMLDTTFVNSASEKGSDELRNGARHSIDGIPAYRVPMLSQIKDEDKDLTPLDPIHYIILSPLTAQSVDWINVPLAMNPVFDGKMIGAQVLQKRIGYAHFLQNPNTLVFNNIK